MRRVQFAGCRIAVGFLVLLCLWTEPVGANQSSLIKVDGSSTVYPVTEAVAEEFQNAHRGKIRVTVGIAGSDRKSVV